MGRTVLIAHAKNEEEFVQTLVGPLRNAGYDVAHEGTVLVGESVVQETARLLEQGVPVVLCGTERAAGNRWVKRLVNTARQINNGMLFIVQMESEADVDSFSFGEKIACYWKDPHTAISELVASLQKYCPVQGDDQNVENPSAESRYRNLLLEACDIINLANLPEQDRHIAQKQQELKLRGLYIPLRVQIEISTKELVDTTDDQTLLESIEQRRTQSRQAGATKVRIAVGERLQQARRLVVLGDPGSGKTTLIRWIATAYLLRLKQDDDWKAIPDIQTLPEANWLPIIVRCRDLDSEALAGSLDDILKHVLKKSELADTEAASVRNLLKMRLKKGQAILMLDGLDEITDPGARASFCQQLDQIVVAYPDAPIIATSRIVGYREMGYKLTRGFEHVTLTDLIPQEKDDFARRWCALTEIPERRSTAAAELIHDIHSAERIERLTGNPMLLTTMALVKRKVGKLPNRRAELYWEAVQVLLNWRREVDEPLDPREAIPQLEYLAYSMCDRGIQQVRQDEALELFARMREEYPNIHAAQNRSPEEFLKRLEARTAILVEAGYVRHLGMLVPVYEFRHLTFQEYLAARALVDGRFPGRNPKQVLAQNVGPLAGRTAEMAFTDYGPQELGVVENWREAIRLCTAICTDHDVDAVLLAILKAAEGEAPAIARARAILASLCLADEPNASEDVAEQIIHALAEHITSEDGDGEAKTGVDIATMALAATRWSNILRTALIKEFCKRPAFERFNAASLTGMVGIQSVPSDVGISTWLTKRVEALKTDNDFEVIGAALDVSELAFQRRAFLVAGLIDELIDQISNDAARSYAAGMALYWLNDQSNWLPTEAERERLLRAFENPQADSRALAFLCRLITKTGDETALHALLTSLNHSDFQLRTSACTALAQLADAQSVPALISCLSDESSEVRTAAANALGSVKSDRAVVPLIALLNDEDFDVRQSAVNAIRAVGVEIKIDNEREQAITALIECLKDAKAGIRSGAAAALGKIRSERAVQPLIALLKDDDYGVRAAAAEALGDLKTEEAIQALMHCLHDVSYFVRHSAAAGIKGIGSETAVPLLLECFEHNEEDRTYMSVALSSFMNEEVESWVARTLHSPDVKLRVSVISLLESVPSAKLIPDLIACMSDTAPEVRSAAAYALADRTKTAAAPVLIQALEDPDPQVQAAAAYALGMMKDAGAVPRLLACLESPSSDVRSAAAYSLGEIKAGNADDSLVLCLNDSDPIVIDSAAYAVGRIGNESTSHLLPLLQSSNGQVRRSAVYGLAQGLDEISRKLLSNDLDGVKPFLDPQEIISELLAHRAARRLDLAVADVKALYGDLSNRFGLKLEWQTS